MTDSHLDDSPEFAVLRQNLAVDRHNAQATGTTDALERKLRRLRRRSRLHGYRGRLLRARLYGRSTFSEGKRNGSSDEHR